MKSLLENLSAQTAAWIRAQRDEHLPIAALLHASEQAALAAHVDQQLLQSARVREVPEITNPPFLAEALSALRVQGIHTSFDFRTVAGITFDTCILVRSRQRGHALLLHELVHVEQYRRLGVAGFARAYVHGLAGAGFVYEANPFEAIAFQLESRFRTGAVFKLTDKVAAWLETGANP